ncbi:alpha/beta fold hydrolase [Leifsonia sp. LS-T14]|uniref:alpha/beta fold hydrolase n=1 Tax=unclassified Leifsonia TaxID=2663824 RepID=UPI0035A5D59F
MSGTGTTPRPSTDVAGLHVRFPDGRIVGLTAIGDPAAKRLVVLCHPTAGASGFDPDPVLTSTWGLHLVSFDRPGFGASDPYPTGSEPSANQWADGVAAYLGQAESSASSTASTDFGSIGVVGWREGGLFAATLAARHPELVDRLALIGCPALPALAETGARAGTRTADANWFDPQRLTSADSRWDATSYERRVERMMADAQLQGTAGVDADLQCFRAEPPNLSTTAAETLVLVGRQDTYATPRDARWFADEIPNSRIVVAEHGGRDLIASTWESILEHVAPEHGQLGPQEGDR